MEKSLLRIISTSHFATINLSHNEDNVLLAIIIESDLKKRLLNRLCKLSEGKRCVQNAHKLLSIFILFEYITGWVIDGSIKLKMEENTNKDLKKRITQIGMRIMDTCIL